MRCLGSCQLSALLSGLAGTGLLRSLLRHFCRLFLLSGRMIRTIGQFTVVQEPDMPAAFLRIAHLDFRGIQRSGRFKRLIGLFLFRRLFLTLRLFPLLSWSEQVLFGHRRRRIGCEVLPLQCLVLRLFFAHGERIVERYDLGSVLAVSDTDMVGHSLIQAVAGRRFLFTEMISVLDHLHDVLLVVRQSLQILCVVGLRPACGQFLRRRDRHRLGQIGQRFIIHAGLSACFGHRLFFSGLFRFQGSRFLRSDPFFFTLLFSALPAHILAFLRFFEERADRCVDEEHQHHQDDQDADQI